MLFLRLLGIAPPDCEIKLDPLRPETAPQVVMPDYVASLSIGGQDPCTFHVEFFLQYRKEVPVTMARYGSSLALQYRRPVQSVLLLLKNDSVPDEIPSVGEYVIGETKVSHQFRTVRLWELDPTPVLSSGDPGLLPWALLMKLGQEGAGCVGAEIGKTGNEQWMARFLTLGSLRYPREELQRMMGGPKMGLVEAIMEGSSLVQYVREKASAEGMAQGKAEGKAEGVAEGAARGQAAEARRLLCLTLAERFPGLETMPELNRIENLADLEALLIQHAIRSQDRDAMAHAILAAAANLSSQP